MGCMSCQKPCFNVGISSQAPVWTVHSLQLPLRNVFLLWCGSFMAYNVDICSSVVLPGLQGDNLLHHGLLYGLQRNLYSSSSSTSSFSTDFDVYRGSPLTFFSLLSLTSSRQHILPFLMCCQRSTIILADGLSCVLQWVYFGADWNCTCLMSWKPLFSQKPPLHFPPSHNSYRVNTI